MENKYNTHVRCAVIGACGYIGKHIVKYLGRKIPNSS